jgi:hypothetical protein
VGFYDDGNAVSDPEVVYENVVNSKLTLIKFRKHASIKKGYFYSVDIMQHDNKHFKISWRGIRIYI